MKRLILFLMLLALPVQAQDPRTLALWKGVTSGNLFGEPRYTTAARPTCNTSNLGATIWNTTLAARQACNGSSWVSFVAGGGVTIGGSVSGGGANAVLFEDASQNLGADATNFFWNTAANGNFLRLGAGTAPGALRLLEGSGTGTNYGALTVPTSLTGNRTYTFPDFDIIVAGSTAALTATRVPFAGANGILTDDADMTFATDTLTLTKIAGTGGVLTLTGDMRPGSSNTGLYLGSAYSATTASVVGFTTNLTPDGPYFALGNVSNSAHIGESADLVNAGFDFNNGRCLTSACTNPSLIIHSPDQVINEYLQLQTDATGAAHVQSDLAEVTVGGFKNNITEASAQPIVQFTLPASAMFGATVTYLVSDGNGTNFIARSGSIIVQGANKAGTATCTILATRDQETEDGSQVVDTGGGFTLTYTWTITNSSGSCNLNLNGASSAGANTYDIVYTVIMNGTSNAIVVTPQ